MPQGTILAHMRELNRASNPIPTPTPMRAPMLIRVPRNEIFYVATNGNMRAQHRYKFGIVGAGSNHWSKQLDDMLKRRLNTYACGYDMPNEYVFIKVVTNARAIERTVRDLVANHAIDRMGRKIDIVEMSWDQLYGIVINTIRFIDDAHDFIMTAPRSYQPAPAPISEAAFSLIEREASVYKCSSCQISIMGADIFASHQCIR